MQKELRPIEKIQTYENVLGQMRMMIENGQWLPGEKLPSERELIDNLQVGRTSIREGLRMLEAIGYIESKPGEGSFVKQEIIIPIGLQNLKQYIEDDDYIQQLMITRELIESQIAFLAAESATDENILHLNQILEKQNKNLGDPKRSVEINEEFHSYLAEMTQNQVLHELQRLLFNLSRRAIFKLFKVSGRSDESYQQHALIYDAIKNNKPGKAHQHMLKHLRSRYQIPGNP